MNNSDVDHHLSQCRAELDHVQTAIGAIGVTSSVVPYLTNYAVIRACGAVEVSFKSLIADFCMKRSKKQIKRFIHLKIRKGSANPSQGNIIRFLEDFDESWKKGFKDNLDSDPNKQRLWASLQSLVDARNEFAHGGSPTMTISDVIQHFDHARQIVVHVDAVII